MTVNTSSPQTVLAELISTDDAENANVEFEPARLNLVNRTVEF